MKALHEQALHVLSGLPLRKIGRFADMLRLDFGALREVSDRRGRLKQVGAWALHVQTSWRFTRSGKILLGVLDFYAYAEDASPYDWDRAGESRFDRIASALNQSLQETETHVLHVASDDVGSVALVLDDGLGFDVFPNVSSDYPDREYWRLFQPSTVHPHYVVSTSAPGSA